VERGARVIGIDISPELIALARQRLALVKLEATVQVGSAYDTGLPDACVDVIFCIALVHHLDIERVRKELRASLRSTDGASGLFLLPRAMQRARSLNCVSKVWIVAVVPHEIILLYAHRLLTQTGDYAH